MTVNTIEFAVLAFLVLVSPGPNPETRPESQGVPRPVRKPEELHFKHDSFTFVRIRYAGQGGQKRRSWATDYPDSDVNLTARIAADLKLKTDPQGKVLELTSPKLSRFPFIYLVEPGSLRLSDDEARSLRTYLLGGGFLLVDDFWGAAEWANFQKQFQRVFPDRSLREIPIEHPLFHCFYEIAAKPQVPSIHDFFSGAEKRVAEEPPQYWGLSDDDGRLLVVVCHNTDLGDGWERADADERYFREVSQKMAYPLGVNIVVYALTDRTEDRQSRLNPAK